MKFFKKTPEKCSVCNQEKIIFKKMKSKGIDLKYCRECYDGYFKVVETRVKDQINQMVKAGRKIGMKEAMDLTKQITAEIEAEQAQEIINETNKPPTISDIIEQDAEIKKAPNISEEKE